MPEQGWSPRLVRRLVDTSPRFVERAVIRLDDQNAWFLPTARFMHDLATWIRKGQSLTPKQLAHARKTLINFHVDKLLEECRKSGPPTAGALSFAKHGYKVKLEELFEGD